MSNTNSASAVNRFHGKVVLVTGGASGIGAATVAAFLQEGATVVSADIRVPVDDHMKTRLVNIELDVSDPDAAKGAVAFAVERFGHLDILVNSAGIGVLEPTEDVTREGWRRTIGINLDGTFFMAQAAIEQMLAAGTGGAIINVASVHGHVGFPGHAAYTASKAGVVNLTRSLGVEYASRGIRVNAICPGFVKTPMIAAGVTDDLMPRVVALHPIGRIAEPQEIAAPILFLASDEASFIVGTSLIADGGYVAQ